MTSFAKAVSVLAFLSMCVTLEACMDCGSSKGTPAQADGAASSSARVIKVPADAALPDAGPIADATADFDAAGPEAANELLVTKSEDEVAVDHVDAVIVTATASPRVNVPRGDIVATIKKGVHVTKLAERDGFFRVTFADPQDASRKLMGWVAHYVFDDLPNIQPGKKFAPLRCAGVGFQVHVVQDRARCAYECKADLECGEGSSCEAAVELPANNELPATMTYAPVCTPLPGVAKKDAGPGIPSLFGSPFDMYGKCPRKYAPALKVGTICYRTCVTDNDCPERASCRSAPGGTKLCYANYADQ